MLVLPPSRRPLPSRPRPRPGCRAVAAVIPGPGPDRWNIDPPGKAPGAGRPGTAGAQVTRGAQGTAACRSLQKKPHPGGNVPVVRGCMRDNITSRRSPTALTGGRSGDLLWPPEVHKV